MVDGGDDVGLAATGRVADENVRRLSSFDRFGVDWRW